MNNYVTKFVKKIHNMTDVDYSNSINDDFEFCLEGRIFSKLRALVSQRITTKAGRVSLCADMDGLPVKIFECNSKEHAKYIDLASQYFDKCMPKCYLRINNYIVAEWVEGKEVTLKDIQSNRDILLKIARMQAAFHTFKPDDIIGAANIGFDYLEDHLISRFNKYRAILPVKDYSNRIFDKIYQYINIFSNDDSVSHPDVTKSNLILTNNSHLKIIDNELLTGNKYYHIDLFNTFRGFMINDEKLLTKYLCAYINCGGRLDLLVRYKELFHNIWTLRLVVSLLQSGRYKDAFNLLIEIDSGSVVPNDNIVIKVAEQLVCN